MVNILIVDDSMITRLRLHNILTTHGYNVIGEADNGTTAIRKYKELQPDITTLDITMPGMNGIDTLRKIREADPDACVVMISALNQKMKILESIRYGAANFVAKPFDDDKILLILQEISQSILKNKSTIVK